ncbi:succinyl-diaminopimelate desuccinylase [Actinoplanes sp. NPDC026623]|uniref:succinyl-diaminopimelate desuccinylase n=1 Tax=Actinoplanes sp. NPDC026623 TaxID=3155610 RepID=UPI0033E57886
MKLDLHDDVVSLTRALCDIPSVSGDEAPIADAVEAALRGLGHLEVLRDGDAVVARTHLGRARRVVLAGHLDTVPIKDNLPTWTTGTGADEILHGRGTVDMKGGVAAQLRIAATVPAPRNDLTFVFYDHEEVASVLNGLGRLVRNHPEWLAGDFAILGEPSNGTVEGGCQGTMRVRITLAGKAAHAARSWRGVNAIHAAGDVLAILNAYEPRTVEVDGLEYREGLSAVNISGGIAGNVIPDECVIDINHRFAPDRSIDAALAHLREVFAGYELEVRDQASGARPGLDQPAAAEFLAAVGRPPAPKFGWTDVARFASLGIPAVNYGPGDPLLAHTDEEHLPTADIRECERVLAAWLR